MKPGWTPAAIADLQHLRQTIEKDRPLAAARMVLRTLEAVENLGRFPRIGRPGRVPGTRELPIPGTPYLVPYRVCGEAVEVLRVLHGRRRWPRRF